MCLLTINFGKRYKSMENSQIEEFYDERLDYCSICHMNPCQCDEIFSRNIDVEYREYMKSQENGS